MTNVVQFPKASDDIAPGLAGLSAAVESGELNVGAAVVVMLAPAGGVTISVFGDATVPAVVGSLHIAAQSIFNASSDD